MRTLAAAVAALLLGAGAAACSSSPPAARPTAKAAVPVASPRASSTPSSSPTPTHAVSPHVPQKSAAPSYSAPKRPKPTHTGCPAAGDVLERAVAPGVPALTVRIGGSDPVTCESTFKSVPETSPTGPGYCTTAAWAKDNPGYNSDAEPSAPLKHIQVRVGPAC